MTHEETLRDLSHDVVMSEVAKDALRAALAVIEAARRVMDDVEDDGVAEQDDVAVDELRGSLREFGGDNG